MSPSRSSSLKLAVLFLLTAEEPVFLNDALDQWNDPVENLLLAVRTGARAFQCFRAGGGLRSELVAG